MKKKRKKTKCKLIYINQVTKLTVQTNKIKGKKLVKSFRGNIKYKNKYVSTSTKHFQRIILNTNIHTYIYIY